MHGRTKQPGRRSASSRRDHRRLVGGHVEQVDQRLGHVVRLIGQRERSRSGCLPWTSSPSQVVRNTHGRRSIARPWRGCRRTSAGAAATIAVAFGASGRATHRRHRLPVSGLLPSRTSSPRRAAYRWGWTLRPRERTGPSSPRSALKNHSRKSSAPTLGPHSSRSVASARRYSAGAAAREAISSMLGWVAAVSATESLVALRPALIHKT